MMFYFPGLVYAINEISCRAKVRVTEAKSYPLPKAFPLPESFISILTTAPPETVAVAAAVFVINPVVIPIES